MAIRSGVRFATPLLSYCPETVISEAVALHFWASGFATIPSGGLAGILGKQGFLGKARWFGVPGSLIVVGRTPLSQ